MLLTADLLPTLATDAAGKAKWSFEGTGPGTDEIKACYDSKCDTSTVEWQFPADVWLNPKSASCTIGEPHILRATINRRTVTGGNPDPLVDKLVTFKVKSGPNAGTVLPSGTTDSNGEAFSQCTGDSTGTNEFEACIVDNGEDICSTSGAVWGAPAPSVSGITLSPASATRNIETTLELEAALTLGTSGGSLSGRPVAFDVISGPHSVKNGVNSTGTCHSVLNPY